MELKFGLDREVYNIPERFRHRTECTNLSVATFRQNCPGRQPIQISPSVGAI